MRVYRLETKTNDGVFYAGGSWTHDYVAAKDRRVKHSSSDMPGPFGEPTTSPVHIHAKATGFTETQLFGFASLAQLKRAFRSKRGRAEMFKVNRIICNVYEVPDEAVLRGVAQVVFDHSRATLLETLDPATFETLLLVDADKSPSEILAAWAVRTQRELT